MNEYELYHHGIKGMKWGVRRYQNKDGSLTPDGLKRYRKEYDEIKNIQRAKIVNKSGVAAIDNYNNKAYDKQIGVLMKRIGSRGLSQFDEEVKREGKVAAEKAMREAEHINKMVLEGVAKGIDPEDSYQFLTNPKDRYDSTYNRYLEEHLVDR